MKTHTNYQTIKVEGKPAFVLVPWADFEKLRPQLEKEKEAENGIPHEVVGAMLLHNHSSIRAWREHLGLTQQELANRLEVSQAAVAKLERPEARPRKATLKKVAAALGLSLEQLDV